MCPCLVIVVGASLAFFVFWDDRISPVPNRPLCFTMLLLLFPFLFYVGSTFL